MIWWIQRIKFKDMTPPIIIHLLMPLVTLDLRSYQMCMRTKQPFTKTKNKNHWGYNLGIYFRMLTISFAQTNILKLYVYNLSLYILTIYITSLPHARESGAQYPSVMKLLMMVRIWGKALYILSFWGLMIFEDQKQSHVLCWQQNQNQIFWA